MRYVVQVLSFFIIAFFITSAQAAVINFDNISSLDHDGIPYPYAGFYFVSPVGAIVVNQNWYNTTYSNTTSFPSGSYAAASIVPESATGGAITISSVAGPFDFLGASFSSWSYDDEYDTLYSDGSYPSISAKSVTINGYAGGNLVGTSTSPIPKGTFAFIDTTGSFNNVDVLVVMGLSDLVGDPYWLMDNFTYAQDSSPAVPAPSAFVLLGTGLFGTLGLRRRLCCV